MVDLLLSFQILDVEGETVVWLLTSLQMRGVEGDTVVDLLRGLWDPVEVNEKLSDWFLWVLVEEGGTVSDWLNGLRVLVEVGEIEVVLLKGPGVSLSF